MHRSSSDRILKTLQAIDYRPFHNSDPPKLANLWNACRLGRGAAVGLNSDAVETLNLSQTYFDRTGLILACDGDKVVGCVHTGFGSNEQRSAICYESGVICAVMVLPDYRRQGIGRELVARAQRHLEAAGAQSIYAGPAEPRDPFYVGMYGGSEPAGFLESDEDAAPFFSGLGYEPVERHTVFQRDISQQREPVSFRLATLRRKTEISVSDRPEKATWWWLTRYGRLDTVHFLLLPKHGGATLARATVVGLDLYIEKWNARAAGITDLYVDENERRKGYGQLLILEICRRLKQELVSIVEAHAPESNLAVLELLRTSGFARCDTGVVYRRGASC